ncbi:uncharacterized protein AMSG_02051 [Thecamonas trahens ATCC 50062]|uniref:Phosphatidic acid phosphatase type 2/haloperoxidase domain-containing protein n=1 Tax=Thecamonas trahens ATCC 50062 TaxID=461836 RepID=A0A0L0DUN0_THETB|nr:hypothetical protein AMSG_02051 [Thecamonas trahens ATCC 50062]KNC56039.1 hypothetical protein AMSG_02051 [Thecamonas trahens ATCC 50062]|eukprot:XP_013761083.1 hypothetical protein AMSG_02051 [Thecamonas trahens ATCC 50062]
MHRRERGLVAVALACGVAAVAVDLEYHVHEWGLPTVAALRHALLSAPASVLARLASACGFEIFLPLVPALIWSGSRRAGALGLRLLALLHYSLLLVSLAKTWFREPRPLHLLREHSGSGSMAVDGASALDSVEYSFPSGHSWATTVAWLTVVDTYSASYAQLRWLAAACIAATAASRVYFALHFVHDVGSGIALGVLTFFAAPSLLSDSRRALAARLVLLATAGYVLIAAFEAHHRQKQLGAWYSLGALVTLAFVPPRAPLLDAAAAAKPGLSPSRLAWRLLVGLTPLGLGLGLIFIRVVRGQRDTELEIILLLAGAAGATWVTVGAPAVFRRLSLA